MKPKWSSWLAILAPFLVMLSWIGMHVIATQNQRRLELPIRGYDPRHLLSGHYMLFTVDYGQDVCKDIYEGKNCVCFGEKPESLAKGSWSGTCNERPKNCGIFISGECESSQFNTGLERYYVSEKHAAKAPVLPDRASLTVAVDGRGRAQIIDLKVQGEQFESWVERQ